MKKYPQQKRQRRHQKKLPSAIFEMSLNIIWNATSPQVTNFRKVLQKRVYKSVRYHHSNTSQKPDYTDVKSSNVKSSKKKIETVDYHTALEQALALVEKEVQHRIEKGELNDLEFSRNKVRLLHKQGNSKMQIKTKLYQKGISSDIIDTVISELYTPSRFLDSQLESHSTSNPQIQENPASNSANPDMGKYDREIIRLQMEREIREISNISPESADTDSSFHQIEPTEHQIHRHIEIQSAIAYAKKRGFGPFRRDEEKRIIKREKDIQSMVRAGHMYHNSKFVIDAVDIDSLFCIDLHSL